MMTVYEILADPMRRHILDLLRERPRLVGELTTLLKITQPGVSKHLRILREAGLVEVRQEAQRHWYELHAEPLAEIDNWLSAYRNLLEVRYERLGDLLTQLQTKEDTNEQSNPNG